MLCKIINQELDNAKIQPDNYGFIYFIMGIFLIFITREFLYDKFLMKRIVLNITEDSSEYQIWNFLCGF